MNYKEFNDYELLYMIGENNETAYEALQKKYEPLVYKKSAETNRYLKNNGLEMEDLMQEGRIALSYAIKNYSDDKNEFITFAHTCIENKINQVNRTFNSNKNKTLNYAMENTTTIINKGIGLENIYISNKNSNSIDLDMIKETLNEEEYEILILKMYGYNIEEISKIMNIKNRHVTYKNVVIKKKLENSVK